MTCHCCSSDSEVLIDLQRDLARLLSATLGNTARLNHLRKEIATMAAREDQAYANLNASIQTVKDGWSSLVAERDALKAALEEENATRAQAVQDALDADSEVDAAKVEAADAALNELVAQPAPGHDDGGEEPPAA